MALTTTIPSSVSMSSRCGSRGRETGMDDYDVLRCITINAAKIQGRGPRQYREGKDADLVMSTATFDYLS